MVLVRYSRLVQHTTGAPSTECAYLAQQPSVAASLPLYLAVHQDSHFGVIDGQQRLAALIHDSAHGIAGFSASARSLARAGVDRRHLRTFNLIHECGHSQLAIDRPTDAAARWPVGDAGYLDSDEAASYGLGSGSGKTLRVVVPLRKKQVALVVIARTLRALALLARSHVGVTAVPVPTQPPGERIRSHPRVPRGPGGPAGPMTWPAGGIVRMA